MQVIHLTMAFVLIVRPASPSRGGSAVFEQQVLSSLVRSDDRNAAQAKAEPSRFIRRRDGQRAVASCDMLTDVTRGRDIRIAALIALAQMNAERARPIIEHVLRRRDEGSVCLRRIAMFLLAAQPAGVENLFLDAARNDPSRDVRKQAVSHLSSFGTEPAVIALDSVVRDSKDREITDIATTALSQSASPYAQAALRVYAERNDLSMDTQRTTIGWLLQQQSAENASVLRRVYSRLAKDDLKMRADVMQWVSQIDDPSNAEWFLNIAADSSETPTLRIQGITLAARMAPSSDLVKLYMPTLGRTLREQLLGIFGERGQRQDSIALEGLAEIAKRDPEVSIRKAAFAFIVQSQDQRATGVLRGILKEN